VSIHAAANIKQDSFATAKDGAVKQREYSKRLTIMKPLLLFIILAISPLASAQIQILELRDDRAFGRKLLVFADNRYQFFPERGTRPDEGVGTIAHLGECRLRIINTTPTHSISVDANPCNQTGTMTLLRFVPDGFITYTIFDKTKE
jgi:hypothetical protein